ncbi:hypothetical protein FIBSPDRAFT_865618 [Athelia psychrophila]|uniref:Uncharacterized protein n=1 Tax=Athelia psychrophila TaxID=1759441 RepID=A0A166FJ51_9AGAM|nr:hypothetical protein FIBSPDRAFT_865613 [Fibularhizoctonia sp. CBS 109695]KZP16863.1 hypothetical protein FIBSPDRAFT_865618 [Fibularhizoctonia sp. CBS 109695]
MRPCLSSSPEVHMDCRNSSLSTAALGVQLPSNDQFGHQFFCSIRRIRSHGTSHETQLLPKRVRLRWII